MGTIDVGRILGKVASGEEMNDKIYGSVCFLDILGFKKLIIKHNNGNGEHEAKRCQIKTFIKCISEILKDFQKHNIDIKHESLILSDSVYIFFNSEDEKCILHLITSIVMFGIRNKIFFRGGLSNQGVDYAESNKQSIFLGMGIIESYELETEIADYSRIVCDKKYKSEFLFTDHDGHSCFDMISFISNNYTDFREQYKISMNSVCAMKEKNCVKSNTEKCGYCKEIVSEVYPDSFGETICKVKSIVGEVKDFYDGNNGGNYGKIYSKYYQFDNYIKQKESELSEQQY